MLFTNILAARGKCKAAGSHPRLKPRSEPQHDRLPASPRASRHRPACRTARIRKPCADRGARFNLRVAHAGGTAPSGHHGQGPRAPAPPPGWAVHSRCRGVRCAGRWPGRRLGLRQASTTARAASGPSSGVLGRHRPWRHDDPDPVPAAGDQPRRGPPGARETRHSGPRHGLASSAARPTSRRPALARWWCCRTERSR